MMETLKNIGAVIVTIFSWVSFISVQTFVAFLLTSLATICSIIMMIHTIRNRILDNRIKREKLKELMKDN